MGEVDHDRATNMPQSRRANDSSKRSSVPASEAAFEISRRQLRQHEAEARKASVGEASIASEEPGAVGEASGAMRCAKDAWHHVCPKARERLGVWRGSELQHMLLAAASVLSGQSIPDGVSALILWVSASC